MKCTTAASQGCTCSGSTSCALSSSAQGTHVVKLPPSLLMTCFGWEDQTSPFLRAEGWFSLLDSSLPLFWERKENLSGKRCLFCLSNINKTNKLGGGLQLLCLGASRGTPIKYLMFLRKTRATLPFTLTLSEHHHSHFLKQAQQARLRCCWRTKCRYTRQKDFGRILYLAEFLLRIKACFLHSLIPWKFFVGNMQRISYSLLSQPSDLETKHQYLSILSLELSTWYWVLLTVMRIILN